MSAQIDPMPRTRSSFVFEHMQLWFLLVLALCITTLVSAIGLLLRKNWARLALVTVLALGILWNITAVVLQQQMMSAMFSPPPDIPKEFSASMDRMMMVGRIFSAAIAAAFSLLFAWLIRKLLTPAVREEFLSEP